MRHDAIGVANRMQRDLIPIGRAVFAIARNLRLRGRAVLERRTNLAHAVIVGHAFAEEGKLLADRLLARVCRFAA